MRNDPYRGEQPFVDRVEFEAWKLQLRNRLRHWVIAWSVVLATLVFVVFADIAGERERQSRLDDQEYRTSVLWQSVEENRHAASIARCRYIERQREEAAQCAALCLEELEDVSRLPSTKRYDECLGCLVRSRRSTWPTKRLSSGI